MSLLMALKAMVPVVRILDAKGRRVIKSTEGVWRTRFLLSWATTTSGSVERGDEAGKREEK